MILGFVENKRRFKPERPDPNGSYQKLLLIGLFFILGFALLLFPFGLFLPVSLSVWALLILFLPLLFLGIMLISKLGYVILLAVLFALLSGGVSILFLGDYIGFISGITSIHHLDPTLVEKKSEFKYIFLKDYKINEELGGSFLAPLMVRARGSAKYYGPVLFFKFAPIVSQQNPNKELSLYALCYAEKDKNCEFDPNVAGGVVLKEMIWDSEKRSVKGMVPKENSIFLVWRNGGENEMQKKGLISALSILLLSSIWSIVVLRLRKKF